MRVLPLHAGDDEGATAVEYAIMVSLIAAVIILIVVLLGRQTDSAFCEVSSSMADGGITATDPGAGC